MLLEELKNLLQHQYLTKKSLINAITSVFDLWKTKNDKTKPKPDKKEKKGTLSRRYPSRTRNAGRNRAKLLGNTDALRRPQRFEQLLEACDCDYHGRLGWEDKPIPAPDLFLNALAAIRAVDAAGARSWPAQCDADRREDCTQRERPQSSELACLTIERVRRKY